MILTETSDKPRRLFPDMEKAVARRDYLKQRCLTARLDCRNSLEGWSVQGKGGFVSHGKMRHSAHMKSFSWFGPHLQGVAGSREQHRCSRIANTC
ncbi:hypothetical protein EMIT0P2_80215 [Pseudomonas sp. IT-P2]